MLRFLDRTQAGQDLAGWFLEWPETSRLGDVIVLARPRGGVLVGAELARALHAPMDVLPVLKIGVPGRRKTPLGAVADNEAPVLDPRLMEVLDLTEDELADEIAGVRQELRRREEVFRHSRPGPDLTGRTVIMVDDGLATGSTARAALRHLRGQGPRRLIFAVPVGTPDVALSLREEADYVVCVHEPEHFRSVAQWYKNFDEVSDEVVIEALRSARALD